MALTCADLQRLVDEGVSLDTREAREHLDRCPGCRATVTRWREVTAKLGQWGELKAPEFLHGRLMAHVRMAETQRQPRLPLLRRFWWAPTLATALLVVMIGVWRVPSGSPVRLGDSHVTAPGAAPAASQAPPHSGERGVHPATPELPHARASNPEPGPVRGQSEPSGGEPGASCELVGPAHERRRLLLLDSWAPPRGVEWAIVVAPSGEVRPATEPPLENGRLPAPLETLEALASLNLQPGRYLLRRAQGPTLPKE